MALPLIQVYSAPEAQGGFTCCIHPQYHNIVVRSVGEDVEIWNTEHRKRMVKLEGVAPQDIGFSSCGKYFFTSGKIGLLRWNVVCDGRECVLDSRTVLIEQACRGIDLSRNNPWLAVAIVDGSKIQIINFHTGETVSKLGSHANLLQVRFTANDDHVLSGT